MRFTPSLMGMIALGGVGAYALTRKQAPPAQPVVSGTSGLGLLKTGESYRVLLTSPSHQDASRALDAMGFETRSLDKDPSARGIWVALANWRGKGNSLPHVPGAKVIRLDPTEPLPDPSELRVPHSKALDPGLTERELSALRFALLDEINPKHLGGFASTFEPDYPIAASLLRAKEALVARRAIGSVHQAKHREKRNARLAKAPDLGAHPFEGFEAFREDIPPFWEEFAGYVSREVSPRAVWLKSHPEGRRDPNLTVRGEASNKVRALVVLLMKDPALLRKSPKEIARAYRVPVEVANHALLCVKEMSDDLRVMVPHYVRLLTPPSRPSPGALHLASAAIKPTLSSVSDVDAGIQVAKATFAMADRGDERAKRAKLALGRASKAIDRERWIRWYDRKRKL